MKKLLNWVRTHKKIALVALLFISFGGSAGAFAWWNSLETERDVVVRVGEGVTIDVDLGNVTSSGSLVPTGQVVLSNQVDKIELTYNIKLVADDFNGGTGEFDLNITRGALTMVGVTDSAILDQVFTVQLNISGQAITGTSIDTITIQQDTEIELEVVVTMSNVREDYHANRDLNQTDFLKTIQNGDLKFNLDFSLTPQEPSSRTEAINLTGSLITP